MVQNYSNLIGLEECDLSLIVLLPVFALYGGGHYLSLFIISFSPTPCTVKEWYLLRHINQFAEYDRAALEIYFD